MLWVKEYGAGNLIFVKIIEYLTLLLTGKSDLQWVVLGYSTQVQRFI